MYDVHCLSFVTSGYLSKSYQPFSWFLIFSIEFFSSCEYLNNIYVGCLHYRLINSYHILNTTVHPLITTQNSYFRCRYDYVFGSWTRMSLSCDLMGYEVIMMKLKQLHGTNQILRYSIDEQLG